LYTHTVSTSIDMLRKHLIKNISRQRHVPVSLRPFSSFFEKLQLKCLFFILLLFLDISQVLLHLSNFLVFILD
jgi:hypothetical protein